MRVTELDIARARQINVQRGKVRSARVARFALRDFLTDATRVVIRASVYP